MKFVLLALFAALTANASTPINYVGRHFLTEVLYGFVDGNQMACKQTDLRNKEYCLNLGSLVHNCTNFSSWNCTPLHADSEAKNSVMFYGVIKTHGEFSVLSSLEFKPEVNATAGEHTLKRVLDAAADYGLICEDEVRGTYVCSNQESGDANVTIKISVKNEKNRIRKIGFKYDLQPKEIK